MVAGVGAAEAERTVLDGIAKCAAPSTLPLGRAEAVRTVLVLEAAAANALGNAGNALFSSAVESFVAVTSHGARVGAETDAVVVHAGACSAVFVGLARFALVTGRRNEARGDARSTGVRVGEAYFAGETAVRAIAAREMASLCRFADGGAVT
ncbi:MAG: hypothetical protein ACI9KE_006120, partial [Polyangiales bacterium]